MTVYFLFSNLSVLFQMTSLVFYLVLNLLSVLILISVFSLFLRSYEIVLSICVRRR